jgi:hypothetical protein
MPGVGVSIHGGSTVGVGVNVTGVGKKSSGTGDGVGVTVAINHVWQFSGSRVGVSVGGIFSSCVAIGVSVAASQGVGVAKSNGVTVHSAISSAESVSVGVGVSG